MVQKLNFLQFYVFWDLVLRNTTNILNTKYYFHLPKPQHNSDTDLYYVTQTFFKILIHNLLLYFLAHVSYNTSGSITFNSMQTGFSLM
jgi:hypothetical protein